MVYQEQTAEWIERACLLEVTARKPGNVHPQAPFDDLTYDDFVHSAFAVKQPLAQAGVIGVGRAILRAIQATQQVVSSNSNLGIVLLLAPLAAVPEGVPLAHGIESILNSLTVADSIELFQAIALAKPGGMGDAAMEDVRTIPTRPLRQIMALAKDRDGIAREFATGFQTVCVTGPGILREIIARDNPGRGDWLAAELAIVELFLDLMARQPDTLIARKCGVETAELAQRVAMGVLQSGWPTTRAGWDQFRSLEAWLRADGHRRNPGTTADLVAAILFAVLRDDPAVRSFLSTFAVTKSR